MTVEIRPLERADDREAFRSGDEALDVYFHRYAGQNQFRHHLGVSYVAVEGRRILGFVTVSAGSLDAGDLPSGRKTPPYPVPILRVARLAVHESARGLGLGKALLRFAIERAERMAGEVGCVGLVVDAKKGAEEFADIDGDGDLDVVLTQVGRAPLLLRNDQKLNHHWIRLKLIGTKSNRDAIGAWITVPVNGQTLSRQVMPTRSYLSQSELPVTIGLGSATKLDSLEVLWPGGTVQKVELVELNRTTTVTEPR